MSDDQVPSTSQNQVKFDFVTSQRGKNQLVRAGYKYSIKRKQKDGSTVWICVKSFCKAILILTCSNILKRDDKHKCEPDFAQNECDILMENCQKTIAADATQPVPSVFRNTLGTIKDAGLDLISKIPKYINIKKKLYRKRNRSLNVAKVYFKTLKEIIIPEKFHSFILADYSTANRIIIFANQNIRSLLMNTSYEVLCDGTFKFCVQPFYQLYTLHVDLGSTKTHNNIVPVIYALLPNKTKNTYETMFRLIKSQIAKWSPKCFIMDFEMAAMQAVQNVFPETPVAGCYFHFTRCLWRKCKYFGINKSNFLKKHIKRCTALAHLPKSSVSDGWLYIMSRSPRDAKLSKFNDYFVEQWLCESSFFFDKWCCYNRQHRTTNMVENWHSTINKKVNMKLKSIAHFLTLLQKEANYTDILIKKGNNIFTKKKETIEFDDYIENIVKEFMAGEINVDLCVELLAI